MAHEDYLTKSGVCYELKLVLRQLVVKQPADPIAFLIKHFESLVKPTREVTVVSADLLREVDALNTAQLDSALYRAFTLLSDTDTEDVLSGRVQGATMNKLLREFCCSLDAHIADPLMSKLEVPPEAVLSFTSFKTVITPTLNLQAFLKMARQVFECMDVQQSGSVSRQVADELLSRLSGSLSAGGKSAELAISPAEISTIMQRSAQKEGVTSLSEFEQAAAKTFINHLPEKPLY